MGPQPANFSTPEHFGTRRKWLVALVTVVTSRLPEFELGFSQDSVIRDSAALASQRPFLKHQGDP
jgi:hypothetical protein